MRLVNFILLSKAVFGQISVEEENNEQHVAFRNQRVVECQLQNQRVVGDLSNLDIWKINPATNTMTVRLRNEQDAHQLLSKSIGCTTKIKDLDNHIANLSKLERPPNEGTMHQLNSTRGNNSTSSSSASLFVKYPGYNAMRGMLKTWSRQYAKYTTYYPSIGKTVEGRDLFAFKVAIPSPQPKRAIWINGGLHAREWISPITVMYLIHQMLNDINQPEVTRLLDAFEFHFTPLANPDGYIYSRKHDRLWRKNRRKNSDGTFGVDLNRNWDEHWGVVGASRTPNDETYCGRFPNSEPEVQALINYVTRLPNPYGGIDFHSYSQMILRNWGWSTQISANEESLATLGERMKMAYQSRGYNFISQSSAGLYPASGALDDWMAAKAKLVSFTVELCPGNDDSSGFQLPPDQIMACASATNLAFREFSNYLLDNPLLPPNQPIV